MSNILFQAIKSGNIKYNRQPKLIRQVTIQKYLQEGYDYFQLVKAMEYSIKNNVSQRSSTPWLIYKNCSPNNLNKLNKIALVGKYQPKSFQQILAVDFQDYLTVINNYPKFKKMLYQNLKS